MLVLRAKYSETQNDAKTYREKSTDIKDSSKPSRPSRDYEEQRIECRLKYLLKKMPGSATMLTQKGLGGGARIYIRGNTPNWKSTNGIPPSDILVLHRLQCLPHCIRDSDLEGLEGSKTSRANPSTLIESLCSLLPNPYDESGSKDDDSKEGDAHTFSPNTQGQYHPRQLSTPCSPLPLVTFEKLFASMRKLLIGDANEMDSRLTSAMEDTHFVHSKELKAIYKWAKISPMGFV